MSTADDRTAADQFDDFIKTQWQDIFRKDVHVKLENGTRYVPNAGAQGVSLLRKNVHAFDAAIKIWSGPTDEPVRPLQGYDRIVDQAGIEYTWEWFLIDPSRPWASAVPEEVRRRIEADLERRDRDALADAKARAEKATKVAEEGDDAMIAMLNSRRAAEGKQPLSDKQQASVRESRRGRRAAQ